MYGELTEILLGKNENLIFHEHFWTWISHSILHKNNFQIFNIFLQDREGGKLKMLI